MVLYLLKFLSLFVSANFLKRKIQKLQILYQDKETNSLVDYSSVLFHKMIYDKKMMIQFVPYSFEGETLMGIKNFDHYLAYLYGDYMTPPPEDSRENRHGIIKVEFNTNEKHSQKNQE